MSLSLTYLHVLSGLNGTVRSNGERREAIEGIEWPVANDLPGPAATLHDVDRDRAVLQRASFVCRNRTEQRKDRDLDRA